MSEKLKLKSSTVLFIISSVIFVDQFSKFVAQNYFAVSCNRGLVFGVSVGEFGSFLVPLLTLSIISYFLYMEAEKENKLALALVLGGGLSNLADRVTSGCVRDFIQIWKFPSFNFADSFITAGIIFIFFFAIFNQRSKTNEV